MRIMITSLVENDYIPTFNPEFLELVFVPDGFKSNAEDSENKQPYEKNFAGIPLDTTPNFVQMYLKVLP